MTAQINAAPSIRNFDMGSPCSEVNRERISVRGLRNSICEDSLPCHCSLASNQRLISKEVSSIGAYQPPRKYREVIPR
ncbi:unannotated protein [freshwater metagenome]|uniref:Unannotated protein n=1 Tax=freshwater metagenome TaxID=449393 RepID=A0A6J6T9Z8_9ZZZZ